MVGNARQTRPGSPHAPEDIERQQKTSARTASEHTNRGEYLNSNNSKRNDLSYRILYILYYIPVIERQSEFIAYYQLSYAL